MKDNIKSTPEKAAENIEAADLLPAEMSEYYDKMHDKHFVRETAIGSLFTEVKNMDDLLELTIKQRPQGLSGDDRVKFAAMGVSPDGLLPQCRYLLVKTAGEVGIVSIKDVGQAESVYVERTKPGTPCTLSVTRENMPQTDIATIIIGPNEQENGSTEEMIWTVHPGLPIRPAREDYWEEGSVITAAEVKDKLGEDKFINVKAR